MTGESDLGDFETDAELEGDTDEPTGPEIKVGDVALDLAQGRPVHVLEDVGQTAAEWSEANGYDLEDNYGNSRLDTGPEDQVFEVVYCSNIKSEPSKTYAMPESRLARVETEAADDGRQVADRVRVQLLEELLTEALSQKEEIEAGWLERIAGDAGIDADLVDEAMELAEVEATIGGDD